MPQGVDDGLDLLFAERRLGDTRDSFRTADTDARNIRDVLDELDAGDLPECADDLIVSSVSDEHHVVPRTAEPAHFGVDLRDQRTCCVDDSKVPHAG
jgi:hypothetical protein